MLITQESLAMISSKFYNWHDSREIRFTLSIHKNYGSDSMVFPNENLAITFVSTQHKFFTGDYRLIIKNMV